MKTLNFLFLASLLICTQETMGSQCPQSPPEPVLIALSRCDFQSNDLPFLSHKGDGPFDTALAMNINYDPALKIRKTINEALKVNLKFFTGWDASGEAHITTITPPEYNLLRQFISIERIEQIALDSEIQHSDLQVLGIGRGQMEINGKTEETYFLICESNNLKNIRRQIYKEFLEKGGAPKSWNPDNFYPHITIGYTLRDLHESDGVIKDIQNSLDSRFLIQWLD